MTISKISGFWITNDRRTTLKGLFAAGDVAGGAPQKYVTGALAEAEIAAEGILDFLKEDNSFDAEASAGEKADAVFGEYSKFLSNAKTELTIEQLEEAMQKVMDEYAGGIRSDYIYNESRLEIAKVKIGELQKILPTLSADDMDELLRIYEIRERLIVCQVLIEHLLARKETRWHSFGENADYPETDPQFKKYVNSVMDEKGEIRIVLKDLI